MFILAIKIVDCVVSWLITLSRDVLLLWKYEFVLSLCMFLLPVVSCVPQVDLVEAVPIGCDHRVRYLGKC